MISGRNVSISCEIGKRPVHASCDILLLILDPIQSHTYHIPLRHRRSRSGQSYFDWANTK